MLKHIFNLRNLLLAAALVAVIGIIAGQQTLLDDTIAEYDDAVAENRAVNEEREALDAEKSDAEAGKGKEEAAREEGYVDDDEIVFVYD